MSYLKEIYAEMGVKNDPPEQYFVSGSRYMLLEKELRSLPPGKICDLGCGRGLLLRRLKDLHVCYGTDYDSGAVQYCQSLGLSAQQADLNEASVLPFPDVKFDAIVISEVLEHLLAPRNALRLIRRHLKPGGILLATVPNAVPLFARFALLFGKSVDWLHYPSPETDQTGHIRFYTLESMARMLKQEGFVVQRSCGVSFRMNGHFWARLCYWGPTIFGHRSEEVYTKMEVWLGQQMPGLSPGLFFVCKNQ